jgi:DNA-directed RNA polymerase sigma subunit (sigma70/sigma32)
MSWEFSLDNCGLLNVMARAWVKRVGFDNLEIDELVQEGLIVLHGLASEFDEEKGLLSSYARRKLWDAWQKLANCYLYPVSFPHDAIFTMTETKKVFWDRARKRGAVVPERIVREAHDDTIDLGEATDWMRKGMGFLTKKDRAMLIQNFGLFGCEEWPIKWMAIQRGISRTTMHKYRDAALGRLVLHMQEIAWLYN